MPQASPVPAQPPNNRAINYQRVRELNERFIKTCPTRDYRSAGMAPDLAYRVLTAIKAGTTVTFPTGGYWLYEYGEVVCEGVVYEWCITYRRHDDPHRRSDLIDDEKVTRRMLNVWRKGTKHPSAP